MDSENTTSVTAVRRDARCYLERREFPLVAMTGAYGTPDFPVAMLQIVVAEDPHFEARTYVEVGLIDSELDISGKALIDGQEKLLFEGELLSYTFVRSAGVNQCLLTCRSTGSYQAQAALSTTSTKAASLPTSIMGKFMGAGTFDSAKEVHKALLTPLAENAAPGLLGGLLHLLHVAYHLNTGKVTFFSAAEDRLKLTRCMGAAPEDNTTERFLKLKGLAKFLDGVLNSVQGGATMPTFMGIKQELLARTFQRSVFLGPGYLAPAATVRYRMYYHTVVLRAFYDYLDKKIDSIKMITAYGSPLAYLLSPGRAQELTKEIEVDYEAYAKELKVTSLSAELQGLWQQVTARIDLGRTFLYQLSFDVPITTTAAIPLYSAAEALGPSAVGALKNTTGLMDAIQKISWIRAAASTALGAVGVVEESRRTLVESYASELEGALETLKEYNNTFWASTTKTGKAPMRFHGEVLLPELYFAVPPACNLILPGDYTEITFNHNVAFEPTRLLLLSPSKTSEGMYFRKRQISYIVAPNIKSVDGKTILEDALTGSHTLLPHEKYSGPVPVIMPIQQALGYTEDDMAEMHQLVAKLKWSVKPTPFLQELAHARFFDLQMGNRVASLRCHRWLHLLPGLPAGLAIRSGLGHDVLHTARVGGINYSLSKDRSFNATLGLTHVMGITERNNYMVYRRMYGAESVGSVDNILDLLAKAKMAPDVGTSVSYYNSALTEIDALQKKKGNQAGTELGEQLSQLAAATDALKIAVEHDTAGAVSDEVAGEEIAGFSGSIITPELHQMAAKDYMQQTPAENENTSEVVGSLTGTGKTSFSAKAITLAYDDLLTPPWLAQCFNKELIGRKVYQPLFGVQSMWDEAHGTLVLAANISVGDIVATFYDNSASSRHLRPLVTMDEFRKFRPVAAGVESMAPTPAAFDPRDRLRLVVAARAKVFELGQTLATSATLGDKQWAEYSPDALAAPVNKTLAGGGPP